MVRCQLRADLPAVDRRPIRLAGLIWQLVAVTRSVQEVPTVLRPEFSS